MHGGKQTAMQLRIEVDGKAVTVDDYQTFVAIFTDISVCLYFVLLQNGKYNTCLGRCIFKPLAML
jgi:hypothetical protein